MLLAVFVMVTSKRKNTIFSFCFHSPLFFYLINTYIMEDDELQAIRARRLAELQGKSGGQAEQVNYSFVGLFDISAKISVDIEWWFFWCSWYGRRCCWWFKGRC
jgi:hypothetical protein